MLLCSFNYPRDNLIKEGDMAGILGIDTIQGLVGSPPKKIALSYNIVKAAEKVRQAWNVRYMAFLPYCFACKEPLVWHSPPGKDNVLFHCPKCMRKWVKDNEWIAKEKEKSNDEALRCRIPHK